MKQVVIIEDETAAARNLEALLREIVPDWQVLATLESVTESVEWLQQHPMPDLLFMDIHLADGDSFRIFQHVEILIPVIFTTAYDQYALEAFKVNSIDYLLKPIARVDLERALKKLNYLLQVRPSESREPLPISLSQSSEESHPAMAKQTVFLLPAGGDKIVPLHRDAIAFCYVQRERLSIVNFEGHCYPIDRTMEAMQGTLPEEDFFRMNRQFLVSRRAIREISQWFNGRLTVRLSVETPERIIIPRARIAEFKRWMSAIEPASS